MSIQEDAPADTFNLWIIKGCLTNGYNMHHLVCCAFQTLVCVIKTHLMLWMLLWIIGVFLWKHWSDWRTHLLLHTDILRGSYQNTWKVNCILKFSNITTKRWKLVKIIVFWFCFFFHNDFSIYISLSIFSWHVLCYTGYLALKNKARLQQCVFIKKCGNCKVMSGFVEIGFEMTQTVKNSLRHIVYI